MESGPLLDPHLKVLIVEDVLTARLVLKKNLSEINLNNVVEAEDGQQAWQKLIEQHDIGLIISDWQMPNMDGVQLLNKIRTDERLAEIPFVMATSLGEVEDMIQAAISGVWGYIVKPVTVAELKKELEDIFKEIREKKKEKGTPS